MFQVSIMQIYFMHILPLHYLVHRKYRCCIRIENQHIKFVIDLKDFVVYGKTLLPPPKKRMGKLCLNA